MVLLWPGGRYPLMETVRTPPPLAKYGWRPAHFFVLTPRAGARLRSAPNQKAAHEYFSLLAGGLEEGFVCASCGMSVDEVCRSIAWLMLTQKASFKRGVTSGPVTCLQRWRTVHELGVGRQGVVLFDLLSGGAEPGLLKVIRQEIAEQLNTACAAGGVPQLSIG